MLSSVQMTVRGVFFVVVGTSDDADLYDGSQSASRWFSVLYNAGCLFFYVVFFANSFFLIFRWINYLDDALEGYLSWSAICFMVLFVVEVLMEIICFILELALHDKRVADIVHDVWYLIVGPVYLVPTFYLGFSGKCSTDVSHNSFDGVGLAGCLSSFFSVFQFVASILDLSEVSVAGHGFSVFCAAQFVSEFVPTISFALLYAFIPCKSKIADLRRSNRRLNAYKLSE